jgi:hypothetical protein
MSTKYAIVYNTTNDSIVCDDNGRVVAPREWAAVQRTKVQDEIAAGHLIAMTPTDIDAITDMSNPLAIRAKEEYDVLVAEWEAEKEEPKEAASKTDYDDSEKKQQTKAGRTSASKNQSAN